MTEATPKDDFREHMRAAFQAWGDGCKSLIPDGFLEKGKEGQREVLLAARSLIDVALEMLGSEDKPKAKPKQKVKVKVEAE